MLKTLTASIAAAVTCGPVFAAVVDRLLVAKMDAARLVDELLQERA